MKLGLVGLLLSGCLAHRPIEPIISQLESNEEIVCFAGEETSNPHTSLSLVLNPNGGTIYEHQFGYSNWDIIKILTPQSNLSFFSRRDARILYKAAIETTKKIDNLYCMSFKP